jgi:hypothetical protein
VRQEYLQGTGRVQDSRLVPGGHMAAADGAEGQEEAPGPEPRLDSITPLYWAIHQSRYQRRAMIEQIQKKTQRELII